MRFTRLAAAFCGVAMVSGSAQAALTFSLETVPSATGAAGPTTVLLVARDPNATADVPVASLQGTWTDQTTGNGLKFLVNSRSGNVDPSGGVGNDDFDLRRPDIKGTLLDVPFRTVQIIVGTDPNGNEVSSTTDPAWKTGMKAARFVSGSTSNAFMYADGLKSASGAVLGAAVIGDANDVITFTGGTMAAVDSSGAALPDQKIPDMSTGSPVPEPTALGLAGVAVVGLARRRRKA